MASKHKPEESIEKLAGAEIVLAEHGTVADAFLRISVTAQNDNRCKEYGGLKMDQAPANEGA